MTVDELMARPDDGRRFELQDGRPIEMPPPLNIHQIMLQWLSTVLDTHCRKHGLGLIMQSPVGVRISKHDYLEPDLIFIPKDHPEAKFVRAMYTHPPSLVVEVLSPGNTAADMISKSRLYRAAKVPNFWLADPLIRVISAFTLKDGDYRPVPQAVPGQLSAPPFPDLTIAFKDVFPDLQPMDAKTEAMSRKLRKLK